MANQGYKIEKVEIHEEQVAKLLKSKEVMSALKRDSKILGTMDSDWVGFDRCHVTVKKEK